MASNFRFSLQAEMWCPQRLPVKDMILKRNEGADGDEVEESMALFEEAL